MMLLDNPGTSHAVYPTLRHAEWHRIFRIIHAPLALPADASLLYAKSFALPLFVVAWLMHRRKWFIKN